MLGAKSIRRDELRRNVVGPNRNGGVFQALEAHVELIRFGLVVRQHRSGGFGRLFTHRERRVVVHVHAHARVELVDRELRLLLRRSGEDFDVGGGVRLERRHEGVVGDGPVRVIGEEQVRAVLERFVAFVLGADRRISRPGPLRAIEIEIELIALLRHEGEVRHRPGFLGIMNNVPRELGIAERNRVFGRMSPVFDTEILAVSRLFNDDVPSLDDAVGKRQTHVAHGRLVAVAVAHRDDVGLRPLVVDEVQFGKLEVDQASHRGIAVLRIQARRDVDRAEIRLPLRSVGVSDFRRRPVLNVLGAVVCGIDRADPAKVLCIRLSENGLVRIGKGAARRYGQRRSDGKRKGMTKGGEHFLSNVRSPVEGTVDIRVIVYRAKNIPADEPTISISFS